MTPALRTNTILAALALPHAEPTPGDAMMARLIEVEARLRATGPGRDVAAEFAASLQRQIAEGAPSFLYAQWTGDLEAIADRREREGRA